MLNWNANGIKIHINTLTAFLNHHNIDIACITETHLSNMDKIKFAGYNVYRADLNSLVRSMDSVAILVHKKIKHHHITIPDLKV
jgi:exonuclease III